LQSFLSISGALSDPLLMLAVAQVAPVFLPFSTAIDPVEVASRVVKRQRERVFTLEMHVPVIVKPEKPPPEPLAAISAPVALGNSVPAFPVAWAKPWEVTRQYTPELSRYRCRVPPRFSHVDRRCASHIALKIL
jgi:hypothetical protein